MSELSGTVAQPAARGTRRARWLLAPLGAFGAFALAAGLAARGRDELPGNFKLFFSDQFHLMTWL